MTLYIFLVVVKNGGGPRRRKRYIECFDGGFISRGDRSICSVVVCFQLNNDLAPPLPRWRDSGILYCGKQLIRNKSYTLTDTIRCSNGTEMNTHIMRERRVAAVYDYDTRDSLFAVLDQDD